MERQGVGVTDTVYLGGRPIARYAAGQGTDLIRVSPCAGPDRPAGRGAGHPAVRYAERYGLPRHRQTEKTPVING
jgi:hypothetical protein